MVAGAAIVVVVLVVAFALLAGHHSSTPSGSDGSSSQSVGGDGGSQGGSDNNGSDDGTTDGTGDDSTSGVGPPGDVVPSQVDVPNQAAPGLDAAGDPVSYDPENMFDGQSSTCWREVGDGSGGEITFTFSQPENIVSVALINGYAKIDPKTHANRYRQERRITQVTWTIGEQDVSQTLNVNDPALQRISVDAAEPVTSVTLRLDATTAHPSADFDYTAISEVRLVAG